ncbi:MAG: hypothetical protein WDM87_00585 [Terracidiphilus sp.]
MSTVNGLPPFPAPGTVGQLRTQSELRDCPYVMAWSLDIQKTLPWGIVMNVGYNGSRSNHLTLSERLARCRTALAPIRPTQ